MSNTKSYRYKLGHRFSKVGPSIASIKRGRPITFKWTNKSGEIPHTSCYYYWVRDFVQEYPMILRLPPKTSQEFLHNFPFCLRISTFIENIIKECKGTQNKSPQKRSALDKKDFDYANNTYKTAIKKLWIWNPQRNLITNKGTNLARDPLHTSKNPIVPLVLHHPKDSTHPHRPKKVTLLPTGWVEKRLLKQHSNISKSSNDSVKCLKQPISNQADKLTILGILMLQSTKK